MKVLLYFEGQKIISKSGIGRAMKHQIAALTSQGIEYTLNSKEHFNIAHISTIGPNSKKIIHYCRKRNIKIIYHAHSTEEDFKNSFIFSNQIAPLFKKRLVALYSQADCIITPTPYSKKLIENYQGISQPVYAVSNGIDIHEFDYNQKRIDIFKEYFHIQPNQKVIISVGLFFQRKGILDFIKVAKALPEYTFIWFGDTPLYSIPQNIRKIVTKDYPENVIFPGYITGDILKGAYAGADAFFFPSYEETEGIVVLEALASYQQVIIRDIPVYEKWLTDKVNCYKGHSVEQFIEIISQVIEKKLPYLGDQGRKVAMNHSIEQIGLQLKSIYEKCLETK